MNNPYRHLYRVPRQKKMGGWSAMELFEERVVEYLLIWAGLENTMTRRHLLKEYKRNPHDENPRPSVYDPIGRRSNTRLALDTFFEFFPEFPVFLKSVPIQRDLTQVSPYELMTKFDRTGLGRLLLSETSSDIPVGVVFNWPQSRGDFLVAHTCFPAERRLGMGSFLWDCADGQGLVIEPFAALLGLIDDHDPKRKWIKSSPEADTESPLPATWHTWKNAPRRRGNKENEDEE